MACARLTDRSAIFRTPKATSTVRAKRAAALGIEGKWAIHPSQIELANEVFSPPEAEVTRARRIIEGAARS
jgi:citrate lyase beta subunit